MDAQQQRTLPQGHQAKATTTTKTRRVRNTGPDSVFIATIRDTIRKTPGTYENVLQLLVSMEAEIFGSARSTSAHSTAVPKAGAANPRAETEALLPPLPKRNKPGAALGSYKDEYAPGRFQPIWGYTSFVPGDLIPDPTVSGGSYYSFVDDGESGGGVQPMQYEHEGEHQQNRDQVQFQVQEYKHEHEHEHEQHQQPANPYPAWSTTAAAAAVQPAIQPDFHMPDAQMPDAQPTTSHHPLPAKPTVNINTTTTTTTPTPFTRTLDFAAQAIGDQRYPNDDSDDPVYACSRSSGVFFPSETCAGWPEFERRVVAGMRMGAAASRDACHEEMEACLTRAVDCLVAGKVLERVQGWGRL